MKFTKKRALFSIALLFAVASAYAQSSLIFLDPEEDSFEMSFKMSQNLIILPLKINGSTPMNFVLDSGISNTIITELTGVDTVSLNYVRELKLAGLGSGEAGLAYASTGNTLILEHPGYTGSGILGKNQDIYVLDEDHFNLSKQLGMQVNGLIGADFFSAFIIEVNYAEKLIRFHNPDSFILSRRFRKYREIPLTLVGQKAFVQGILIQDDKTEIKLKMLIDTGASLPLWIAAHSNQSIHIPDKTIPAMLGQGLNGPIEGVNARVNCFEFAGYKFNKPVVSFPDSTSLKGMVEGYQRNGSLGNDILRRFNILFDFPHSRVLLKANKDLNDIFSYNKSGMEIEKPFFALPIYSVFNVIPNSPAEKAGVQVGDILTMINYQPTTSLRMDNINSILHGHSGKKVQIRLNRNGRSLKYHFRLQGEI